LNAFCDSFWCLPISKNAISLQNKAFIGVPLEKGAHRIEMTYTTPYFYQGLGISIASLLLLIGYQLRLKKNVSKSNVGVGEFPPTP
jgi:uncharacterized membrane protein YfhO